MKKRKIKDPILVSSTKSYLFNCLCYLLGVASVWITHGLALWASLIISFLIPTMIVFAHGRITKKGFKNLIDFVVDRDKESLKLLKDTIQQTQNEFILNNKQQTNENRPDNRDNCR